MEKKVLIAEGKTKTVRVVEGGEKVFVVIKNKKDITKHDDPKLTQQMELKDVYATATTCAVFELLKQAGIPVAYERRLSETEFIAPACKMIKLEVIARRYAVGSYLDRNPHLRTAEGTPPYRFHRLLFETFLKTTGGQIKDKDDFVRGETPFDIRSASDNKRIDDPLISNPYEAIWGLVHPKVPSWDEYSNLHSPVFRNLILPGDESAMLKEIEEVTRKTFLVLEGAWAQLGCRLIDFKIEFGIGPNGELMVADVIDNDSWRLRTSDWKELSKQNFRDNLGMEEIASKYALVAKMVERFRIPQQAIVTWRGSGSDIELDFVKSPGIDVVDVVLSGHKVPRQCCNKLEEILAAYPEGGVIVTPVGMSNGLGPTISARTSWPVIAVPTTAKERPHDVWSSLETPSNIPLATILSPKNAVLAALNILALKNPIAYMHRQYAIELLDE